MKRKHQPGACCCGDIVVTRPCANCEASQEQLPAQVTVTTSAWSNNQFNWCNSCPEITGAYVLDYDGPGNPCNYTACFPLTPCTWVSDTVESLRVSLEIQVNRYRVRFTLQTGTCASPITGVDEYAFDNVPTSPPKDANSTCGGQILTCTYEQSGSTPALDHWCDHPATVSLDIP